MEASPRRARRIALAGLAALGLAGATFTVRRPLLMAAPACTAGRWHGCFDTENGVLLMMLAGLPLPALVVCALALGRRAAGAATAWRTSLAEVGMVYGTVPLVWITLMPGPGAGIVPGRLSLIPLSDLVTMGPLGIGGNLLIFAALGFFAPLRFPALASVPRILALGAVQNRPWEFQGELALRRVMTLSLSFDHRVIDGAEASQFLAELGALLADPALAMLHDAGTAPLPLQ